MTDPDAGTAASLSLKANPERLPELLEREGIRRAPYVGRYGWVALDNYNVLPPAELRALVRESYALVAAKLPKARKKKARAVRHR